MYLTSARSLSVLKTTQSGWAGFHRDAYTTLPETNERLLATTINAKWTYIATEKSTVSQLPFGNLHIRIRNRLLSTFFGPPATGSYSKGVQETLFQMGKAVIENETALKNITLTLPNLHFLPCIIPVYQKNKIKFEDDVYIPSDEPHGVITATIERSSGNVSHAAAQRRSKM